MISQVNTDKVFSLGQSVLQMTPKTIYWLIDSYGYDRTRRAICFFAGMALESPSNFYCDAQNQNYSSDPSAVIWRARASCKAVIKDQKKGLAMNLAPELYKKEYCQ
jgi:predicted chitinase